MSERLHITMTLARRELEASLCHFVWANWFRPCRPGRLLFLNPDLFWPSPASPLRGKKS